MSVVRYLADHDLNRKIRDGVLRIEPSIEFLRARDVGAGTWLDDQVLAYAAERGLIVVSHDVNTMTAAAYQRVIAGLPMAGLLLAVQQRPLKTAIDELVLIWSATEFEEWKDRVQYIS